ncbi:MAG: phage integrase family protein, partial [Armatimonadetes bacterium]|nr:phage integrase family protein [Armatimonadota bacterium]
AYLTTDQMERLLAVAEGSSERAVSALLCYLGLRRGEVVSLDCGDVDLSASRIHIRNSKGGKSRTLPIPPELRPSLEVHLPDRDGIPSDPLFLSCRGNRLSRSALGRLFDRWLERADLQGLGLSPHSCRHGCASRWLRSGLTIVEVQQLLGHSSVDVTGKYCHASVEEIAGSLEAKVAPLGQGVDLPSEGSVPAAWEEVLARLDPDQSAALLILARSMVS